MIFSFFLMKLKHVYFVLSLSLSLSLFLNTKQEIFSASCMNISTSTLAHGILFLFCSVLSLSLNLKPTHSLYHSIEHLFCFYPWFLFLFLLIQTNARPDLHQCTFDSPSEFQIECGTTVTDVDRKPH